MGHNFPRNTSVFLTPGIGSMVLLTPVANQLLKEGGGKTKRKEQKVLSTGSREAALASSVQKQTFSQVSSHSTPKKGSPLGNHIFQAFWGSSQVPFSTESQTSIFPTFEPTYSGISVVK